MGGFTPKKAGDFNYDKFRFWLANQWIYALLPYLSTSQKSMMAYEQSLKLFEQRYMLLKGIISSKLGFLKPYILLFFYHNQLEIFNIFRNYQNKRFSKTRYMSIWIFCL